MLHFRIFAGKPSLRLRYARPASIDWDVHDTSSADVSLSPLATLHYLSHMLDGMVVVGIISLLQHIFDFTARYFDRFST